LFRNQRDLSSDISPPISLHVISESRFEISYLAMDRPKSPIGEMATPQKMFLKVTSPNDGKTKLQRFGSKANILRSSFEDLKKL